MEFIRTSAPLVEQLSIGEAFLDISDDQRPGTQVAASLQAEIGQRFGLPTSWGVASNKLVAKIATEYFTFSERMAWILQQEQEVRISDQLLKSENHDRCQPN